MRDHDVPRRACVCSCLLMVFGHVAGYSSGAGSCFGPGGGHGPVAIDRDETGGLTFETDGMEPEAKKEAGGRGMNYVGVEMKITIHSMKCPYNIQPMPRLCLDMAESFTGFLVMADQGSFDITKGSPGQQHMDCPDKVSPLYKDVPQFGSDAQPVWTPAVTHKYVATRHNLTLYLTPKKAGTMRLLAYIVKKRTNPILGEWFQIKTTRYISPKSAILAPVQGHGTGSAGDPSQTIHASWNGAGINDAKSRMHTQMVLARGAMCAAGLFLVFAVST